MKVPIHDQRATRGYALHLTFIFNYLLYKGSFLHICKVKGIKMEISKQSSKFFLIPLVDK